MNSLSENESDGPECNDDGGPCSPSNDTVAVGMSRVAHQSLKDEFAGDVGVKSTNDDGGDQDKGKRRFSLPWFEQRSDRRCSGVLTKVLVPDSGDDREQDKFKDRENGESFREVFGLLHLGDERWVQNLTDPEEGDAVRQ
jgi:hypothetical protein